MKKVVATIVALSVLAMAGAAAAHPHHAHQVCHWHNHHKSCHWVH